MVAELRKRLFCAAFIQDKQLATFTGRPLALSRRYIRYQLSLGLSDEELVTEGEQLADLVSGLDADGWSPENKRSHTAVTRALRLMSLIRDEILEVSLGPDLRLGQPQRQDIKRRSDETYAKLPAYLRFESEAITSAQTPYNFVTQIALSLEFLLNRFLIERLPDDGSQQSKQDLINTSKEMLDRVILLSSH
ncbi:hypothetical protein MMC30_000872 [Trapelia coarctata]|nr:hypothetical protein [Trapelia coarctata]